jgi:site-specific DNA recombinase
MGKVKAPQTSKALPFDGYIRVSRVAGRSGESFLSPDIQKETIQRLAQANGLIIDEIVEQLGVSGGKDIEDRELDRLIKKIEDGKSGGLIVWKVSRYSRDLTDGVINAKRIREAGGRIIGSDLDSTAPMGKALLGFLLGWAEEELDARREDWDVAQSSAIERGIHFASTVPFGYIREKGKPMEIDPETAPIVKQIFERRVAGESLGSLARWLAELGHFPKAQDSTVWRIIKNRAYLGEARHGEHVKRNAHPTLVSQLLFDQANERKKPKPDRTGALASQTILAGLPKCESCEYTLQLSPDHNGRARFACKRQECAARASIFADDLDTEVLARVFAYLNKNGRARLHTPETAMSDADLAEAEKALEEAMYDRQQFIGNKELRRLLSHEEYSAELKGLNEALQVAQMAVEISQPETKPAMVEDFEGWFTEQTHESQGEWIEKFLDSIIVRPTARRRLPVETRVAISERGTDRWLLPDGLYGAEPFAAARDSSRFATLGAKRLTADLADRIARDKKRSEARAKRSA